MSTVHPIPDTGVFAVRCAREDESGERCYSRFLHPGAKHGSIVTFMPDGWVVGSVIDGDPKFICPTHAHTWRILEREEEIKRGNTG